MSTLEESVLRDIEVANRGSPPHLLQFVGSSMRMDPEVNCTCGRRAVLHVQGLGKHSRSFSLNEFGSILVYILREQLPRSPLPRPLWTRSTGARARLTFLHTTMALCLVVKATRSRIIGRAETLEVEKGRILSVAAQQLAKCLFLLQTQTRRARGDSSCIIGSRCSEPAVPAPRVGDDICTLEVQCNHRCNCGYTTIDAVSILPPVREFHTPMLCARHQHEFQTLLYYVVNPSEWRFPEHVLDGEDRRSLNEGRR